MLLWRSHLHVKACEEGVQGREEIKMIRKQEGKEMEGMRRIRKQGKYRREELLDEGREMRGKHLFSLRGLAN